MTSRPATGPPPGVQAGPQSHEPPVTLAPAGTSGHVRPIEQEPAQDGHVTPVAAPAPATKHIAPDSAAAPATPDLAGDRPAERHRLSPRVTRYWRWRALFSTVPILVFAAGLAYIIPWGPWWMRWGIVGILVALVAVGMVILPPIRYRVFWYAISETEIDIQHKIIFIERIVIPIHRVQSLRTERGPMADHYQMTNLKISTAGGSITISGLDRQEANDLCDRISELANIVDDV